MASNPTQKPGLTTFGWLALGTAAAAILANPARREKLTSGARDLFNKFSPSAPTASTPPTA